MTTKAFNAQSIADNMKECCELQLNDGYSCAQAMLQMDLAPWRQGLPVLSTCQMWMQCWKVVNCNWPAFRAALKRPGAPLVGVAFYQSILAKNLATDFMIMYLDEVRVLVFVHKLNDCVRLLTCTSKHYERAGAISQSYTIIDGITNFVLCSCHFPVIHNHCLLRYILSILQVERAGAKGPDDMDETEDARTAIALPLPAPLGVCIHMCTRMCVNVCRRGCVRVRMHLIVFIRVCIFALVTGYVQIRLQRRTLHAAAEVRHARSCAGVVEAAQEEKVSRSVLELTN